MTATVQKGTDGMLAQVDQARCLVREKLLKKQKLEQYFSSAPLARMMASMMDYSQKDIRILDPGAGVGSLFTACVEHICRRRSLPDSIQVTAYEVDSLLFDSIDTALGLVGDACSGLGIGFSGSLAKRDFIRDHAGRLGSPKGEFTHVITNPPYKKINASSELYRRLRDAGLEATNMYAAFIAVSHSLLGGGGQMTFISPRSFCNGAYFYPFRRDFLESMSPRKIHTFGSRTSSFSDDGVLQENVIICAKRNGRNRGVVVSSGNGPYDGTAQRRHTRMSDVVLKGDPKKFIHIVCDESGARVSEIMRGLPCTLADIGVGVSTGKVVDFRISGELRFDCEEGAVPLVRPFNVSDGITRFPIKSRKHCNFIMANRRSEKLLVENGDYVIVKRFTVAEQKKRIVASVWSKREHETDTVGFENRVNYFHSGGAGLAPCMARGLWAFLNSTPADTYFRQFSGSTQVNAADLRYLRYPQVRHLKMLGDAAEFGMEQREIDGLVKDTLFEAAVTGR